MLFHDIIDQRGKLIHPTIDNMQLKAMFDSEIEKNFFRIRNFVKQVWKNC